MAQVWGIHMQEWVGHDPIEFGYVGISWPLIGNIFKIEGDREKYKEALRSSSPNITEGSLPVQAGILYRFAHEVKEGDYVVYPSKNDRMVNIGRFKGEGFFVPAEEGEEDESYPNRRSVEWIGHFPRSEFSQSALYEIGAFITLFAIKRHQKEFLAKIEIGQIEQNDETENEESGDDVSITKNVSQQAVETTHDYVIKRIMSRLNGYEFEHFTAHLLECMGYTARVSEKSGDGGVDIIAHTDELGFEPPIIKVQCKRITEQTGEPEVSQLLGTLGEGEFALFVNLGSFSKPARVLERNKAKLRLIGGEQLVELIFEHYEKLSARYRTLIPLRQIYVPDIIEDQD